MNILFLSFVTFFTYGLFAQDNCTAKLSAIVVQKELEKTSRKLEVLFAQELNVFEINTGFDDYQIVLIDRANVVTVRSPQTGAKIILAPILSYDVSVDKNCNVISLEHKFTSRIQIN